MFCNLEFQKLVSKNILKSDDCMFYIARRLSVLTLPLLEAFLIVWYSAS